MDIIKLPLKGLHDGDDGGDLNAKGFAILRSRLVSISNLQVSSIKRRGIFQSPKKPIGFWQNTAHLKHL
jgi:hypothetical protein